MILRSVGLESFGRFKGQTIEFRRGLNLVIGPNEAGKSTLAEAVPAVLFGSNHLEKYKPWGRNTCTASLFFEGGGRTIEIKRNLLTDDVELVEKDDLYHVLSHFSGKAPLRGRSASCKEYRELVETLLGVGDDKLFRATYFFGHYPQEWTGNDLAQNLRTLVSGTAEADYAAILDDLLEEHFSLTSSNPWGRDKKHDREYEQICAELNRGDKPSEIPVFVEIDDTADLREQIEALSAELVSDRLEYEKGLKYVAHVRRQLADQHSETREQEAAPSEDREVVARGSVTQRLTEVGLPENPPRELPQLLAEAAEIRQALAELQQPYAMLAQQEKRVPEVPWGLLGGLAAGAALYAGVAYWMEWVRLWSCLGAGAVVAGCLGFGFWKALERKKAFAECKKQRGRLDQKKIAAQSRQTELTERCEAVGLPSSPIDLVRLQKLVHLHQQLLDAYWAGDDNGVGDEVAVVPEAQEEERRPEASASDNRELREMEERLKEFEEGLAKKEGQLAELQKKLDAASQAQPVGGGISNQPLYRRKTELEERIEVLRKSVNLLAAAVDSFGKSHLVKLNEETSRLFGKITAGRYNEVRLDDNMLPSVKVDGRRWVSVDNFSRGTVDAIYLALRVALAKVRGDGRSLPLMLDDPFVHLDQKRLAKALNLIDLAAADGQLILFSHNMELGKRAAKERWHVVPLDGDTVESTTEEGEDHGGQLHLL